MERKGFRAENSWTDDKQFAADWNVSKHNRRPQGCVGRRMDSSLSDGLPVPHHIKINVDGLEHRVVSGMLETLAHSELKSVRIEISFDNPKNPEAVEMMESRGWKYSWDQLRINRKVKLTVDQIKNYQQRGVGGLNYIFYKDNSYSDLFSKLLTDYEPGKPLEIAPLLDAVGQVEAQSQ